jgi:hypothetical protein
MKDRLPARAGGVRSSQGRKDGRSQRGTLANNLAAHAADEIAEHSGTMQKAADIVKSAL